MRSRLANRVGELVRDAQVLVIDDNAYMRKVVRTLLMNVGVKSVQEAADGLAGIEAIRVHAPDLVILDWEMPLLSGPEVLRVVRSPGVFPAADVPIIMLTGHVERWRVIEAQRLGVNEFLRKPVSANALMHRMLAILAKPRPMVRLGDYYGPEPRRMFCDADAPAVTIAPMTTAEPAA